MLGQVARGGNPAEQRKLDREAITVKELCTRYLADLEQGLILGKRGRPKKATTIVTDTGRIHRHLIPLLGSRRVRDLAKADITQAMKDIMAGKTRANVKTEKLRGRAIVRGGVGTATRTIGLLGGILSYAVELGIIEHNPAHGVRKPKDNINSRRLSEEEYRTLGEILGRATEDRERSATAAEMIRVLALTGCRRSEVIKLRWNEVDVEGSCLRLTDSKEGASVRRVSLPVLETSRVGVKTRKAMSSLVGLTTRLSEASQDNGRRYWTRLSWQTSRRMSCGTALPASPMILVSPRRPLPRWSRPFAWDDHEPLYTHRGHRAHHGRKRFRRIHPRSAGRRRLPPHYLCARPGFAEGVAHTSLGRQIRQRMRVIATRHNR